MMLRTPWFSIVWLAAWPLPVGAAPEKARLVAVGQAEVLAALLEATPSTLTFEAAGQPRSVAWDDLVSWGDPAEALRGPQWILSDGGLLVAELIEADAESLTLQSPLLGRVKLPRQRLRGALFDVPGDPAARDAALHAVREAEAGGDRLWLVNGDRLAGSLRNLGRDAFEFESDVGLVKVPRESVAAMACDVAPREAAALPQVGLRDGSRLSVARLTADGKNVQLQIDGGDSWTAPREALAWVRGASSRVTYLSDLRPSGYRHVPYLAQKWDYQLDRNVLGGQLRSGGRLASKGVGQHSTSLVSWDLPPGAQRFAARVGIDDTARQGGSVVFRVFLDGREAAASGIVRGGDPPRELSVDLGSAKTISLVVDFADRGDVLDRADWLDARIER